LNAEISCERTPKFYDFRCDVWSLGVIIHNILAGALPYSLEEIVAYVEDTQDLPVLTHSGAFSGEAFDFVAESLNPIYKLRPSSRQLARHDFLATKGSSQTAFLNLDKDGSGTVDMQEMQEFLLHRGQEETAVQELFERLDADKDGLISQAEFQEGFAAFAAKEAKKMSKEALADMTKNVQQFAAASNMKKAVLTAAARHLGGYELQQLRELFESVDTNGDGAISLEEWTMGFALADDEPSLGWLEEAFKALDTDGSGDIDYSEFLAAVMDSQLLERRDLLWAAFQDFDRSNTGSISKADLQQILHKEAVQEILLAQCPKDSVESMLAAVKFDDAGELSFDAFIELLHLS